MIDDIKYIRELHDALSHAKLATDRAGRELRLVRGILRHTHEHTTDEAQKNVVGRALDGIERVLAELDGIERLERPTIGKEAE